MPQWLYNLAIISLITAGICSLIIALDIFTKHPHILWIMQVVWPVTALWSGPFGLYAYYKVGRLSTKQRVQRAKERGEDPPNKKKPFWQSVGVGASHCGSGCTLGDIVAEWFVFFVPIVIFGSHIFGTWVLDYIVAFIFGIAFQYFTIKPMRGVSMGEGLKLPLILHSAKLNNYQYVKHLQIK
jgi:Domain of unknown function (DUF4396)